MRPLLLLVLLAAVAASAAAADDPFAPCAAQLAVDDDRYAAGSCVYAAARRSGRLADGIDRLDALIARHGDDGWLAYHQAFLAHRRSAPFTAVRARYRAAQRAFDVDPADQVARARAAWVQLNLAELSLGYQQLDAARRDLDEAARRLDALDAPPSSHRVQLRIFAATLARMTGRFHDAYDHLDAIRRDARSVPETWRTWQRSRIRALQSLGRHAEACDQLDALYADAATEDVVAARVAEPFDRFLCRINQHKALPTPAVRRHMRDRIAAIRTQLDALPDDRPTALATNVQLAYGRLHADEGGLDALDACLAIDAGPANLALRRTRGQCLLARAVRETTDQPERARDRLRQSLGTGFDPADPLSLLYGLTDRLHLLWTLLPAAQAEPLSHAWIRAVEQLRALQQLDQTRAAVLQSWIHPYYGTAGRLWTHAARADAAGQNARAAHLRAHAFAVIERMRARMLVDLRQRAELTDRPPLTATARRHVARALNRSLTLRLRRLDTTIEDVARDPQQPFADARVRTLLAQLGADAAAPSLDFDQLDAVQAALGPRDAMLAYQLGLDRDLYGTPAGGAWLAVITRDAVRSHRLPDRVALDARLTQAALPQAVAQRDGRETADAVALHRDLVAPALDDLPADVAHLILVPDDRLHHVPFELLRAAPDAPPLIDRYRLSVAPSATLWLDARRRTLPAATTAADVLVVADPRGQPPLPHAGREADGICRSLGRSRCDIRQGEAARADVVAGAGAGAGAGRRIVHVAAHAVVDVDRPGDSAILLTPTDARPDGRLRARDIARLRLDDPLVVLSACSTADGQLLQGEGLLSLAHAFFQAGARTVVASRWPLRDHEAHDFFLATYAQLDRGMTIAEAVAHSARQQRAAGRPAELWAGVVVLGDGDWRLRDRSADDRSAGDHDPPDARRLAGAALLGLGLLLGGWHLRAASRRRTA
ncbi:MAG: CHAT domain-containing protein [Acidobacteriota bacterium]